MGKVDPEGLSFKNVNTPENSRSSEGLEGAGNGDEQQEERSDE